MKGFFRSKLALSLVAVIMLASAFTIPLVSGSITRTHAASTGQSFTFLKAGFTQQIFGVSSSFMGGVAFAPNGDAWVDECAFAGSALHRYDAQTTTVINGTTLHPESIVASAAGCGMTNHPDGTLYSNTSSGVTNLDANTGALIRTLGPAGNALGITVDPQTNHLVYVGADCRFTSTCSIIDLDPVSGTSKNFAVLSATDAQFVDGIYFDSSGNFLFLSNRSPQFRLTVLNRSGAIVQHVPMNSEPDGIAFHGGTAKFVVTNNTDGTMTRFDFPNDDFTQIPTQSVFASGGFRGDLSQVGSDNCLYITQNGTRYDDGTVTSQDSLVRLCPGFVPPPGVAHRQLFILLQGIDTSLSQQDVDMNGGLGTIPDFNSTGKNNVQGIEPFLMTKFPNAQFLAFSYNPHGSNPSNGHPVPYSCLDTFQNPIDFDAKLLADQIASYLNAPENKPFTTDVYLIGHSLGGVVALAYLTALLEAPNQVTPLPANGHLAGVITLDSPVGGVSSNKGLLTFIFNVVFKQKPTPSNLFSCPGLVDKTTQFNSVQELANLFDTTSQPTFPATDDGGPGSQGAHASILKAIFQGKAFTNQGLVQEAAAKGTPVLTIGNTWDYLYNPSACTFVGGDFTTSQWIDDEGPNETSLEGGNSPIAVYGREFTAGQQFCPGTAVYPFNLLNHKEVYNNTAVETALSQFLPSGGQPVALLEAPPELS